MVKLSEPLTAGDVRPAAEDDTDEVSGAHRAQHLLTLGHQLFEMGRQEDAIAMAEEAIAVYRQLAWTDPDTFAPDLARALTDVGLLMCEVSWRLALAPAEEAIAMYRRLTEADLHALPDLASSLSHLASFLAEMSSCQPSHVTL